MLSFLTRWFGNKRQELREYERGWKLAEDLYLLFEYELEEIEKVSANSCDEHEREGMHDYVAWARSTGDV